jgi:galactokinase
MTAASHSFETLFDHAPHVRTRASGMVLLGRSRKADQGTDPARERIVAAPVPLTTYVLLARRRDPVVHAASANVEGPARMVYVLGEETQWGAWVDRVQNVTLALREAGHDLSGFDVLARSNVPIGGGLAAGSALVVAVLRALRQAFALTMDDDALACLAAKASGDPIAMATAYACDNAAIVIEDGAHEVIPMPSDLELRVVEGRDLEPAEPPDARDVEGALRSGDVDRLLGIGGTPRPISKTMSIALAKRAVRAA